MKKATIWLLLTIYLGATCASLLPLVCDVMAHLFWHEAHIKQVHHGKKDKAHVTAEIAQLLNVDQNQPATFAESSWGGKSNLSAHDLPTAAFETCPLASKSLAAFPSQFFKLTPGMKPSVFLPPKRS